MIHGFRPNNPQAAHTRRVATRANFSSEGGEGISQGMGMDHNY